MESYLATMSWAVGTCASNQQLSSVLKLLKLHMPDVNEGANSVDYLKKVFCQTKDDNVWDTIKKYKQKIAARRNSDESLLTDITDGAEYVKFYQGEGFLSCPNNISFIVNTGKCS
ncbi:unnamed protein product [Porites lobata]|uniref:Uncharacterized protein n=1 Tax=Porites lobata TaxID=104759 RepID=A0ABN8PAD4_9CNID|nr:unnamed protein product [Porites lobata]